MIGYITKKTGSNARLKSREKSRKNEQLIKKSVGTLVLIGIILYLFADFKLNENILNVKDRFDFQKNLDHNNSRFDSYEYGKDAYFVNMYGCKIPSLDITNGKILSKSNLQDSIKCYKPLTQTQNNKLFLNMEKMEIQFYYNITNFENISCFYQPFVRRSDNINEFKRNKHWFDLTKAVTINFEDFIKVSCNTYNDKSFYENYHILTKDITPKVKKIIDKSPTKVSVMVIGFQSMSHLHFLRQMRRTAQHLQKTLNTIEFFGYSKIGKSTFQNLVPILTGFDERELILACLSAYPNQPFDECPFIWKKFNAKAYRTLLAEDSANMGIFNNLQRGFRKSPTDYYNRPQLIELDRLIAEEKLTTKSSICIKEGRFLQTIMDHIKNMIPHFIEFDFFSVYWISDSIYDTPSIDSDINNLIVRLSKNHVLNKTILFFVSDQGASLSKTYEELMEERQPFLYVTLPKWFEAIYPMAVSNLRQNTRKLTTHYDLHQTLLDLINLNSIANDEVVKRSKEIQEADIYPRGISLFLTVPNNRTCEHAGIAYDWCTCHEKQNIPTNDPTVQHAARFIIQIINDKIRKFTLCRTLHLNSILRATISSTNKKILKDIHNGHVIDVMVRIQTKPGLAEYESTVRMTPYSKLLIENIKRINYFGRQSYCIDDENLKRFCYCYR